MKVKELINALSVCNSETEVHFQYGEDNDYRLACARLIAEQDLNVDYKDDVTSMLYCLEVSNISIDLKHDNVDITLEQDLINEQDINDEIVKIRLLRKGDGA